MAELDFRAGGQQKLNGAILEEGVKRLAAEGKIHLVGARVQRSPQADLVKWAQESECPIIAEGVDIYIAPVNPIYRKKNSALMAQENERIRRELGIPQEGWVMPWSSCDKIWNKDELGWQRINPESHFEPPMTRQIDIYGIDQIGKFTRDATTRGRVTVTPDESTNPSFQSFSGVVNERASNEYPIERHIQVRIYPNRERAAFDLRFDEGNADDIDRAEAAATLLKNERKIERRQRLRALLGLQDKAQQ